MNILAATGIWCLFVCAVFACQLYCKGSVEARLGERRAHVLFVLVSSVAVFVLGAIFLSDYPETDNAALLWLGGLWLGLSLAFELLLCRVVLGLLWSRIFRDYNLFRGRLYPLLLVTVFFTPLASYHLFFV
jgi:MFS-type transporter involved in bile tolerance (Atg22 family)